MRALGGLLFGVAILVVLFRRTALGDPWATCRIFLVLLIVAVALLAASATPALGDRPNDC
jgi:hypothetical protein